MIKIIMVVLFIGVLVFSFKTTEDKHITVNKTTYHKSNVVYHHDTVFIPKGIVVITTQSTFYNQ
jgi:hypothetical protein